MGVREKYRGGYPGYPWRSRHVPSGGSVVGFTAWTCISSKYTLVTVRFARHPLFIMSSEARHRTMMTAGSHYGVQRAPPALCHVERSETSYNDDRRFAMSSEARHRTMMTAGSHYGVRRAPPALCHVERSETSYNDDRRFALWRAARATRSLSCRAKRDIVQ